MREVIEGSITTGDDVAPVRLDLWSSYRRQPWPRWNPGWWNRGWNLG
jgi:hypothetical protein